MSTRIVAAASRMRLSVVALGVGVLIGLWVGVGVALAESYGTYFSGTWYAGQTHPSAYDDTCSFPYWINYDEFDKGSSDYGRVMFITSGGTWKQGKVGYGVIATSEPNYKYQKKAAARNPTGIGYTGSALLGFTGSGGICT